MIKIDFFDKTRILQIERRKTVERLKHQCDQLEGYPWQPMLGKFGIYVIRYDTIR